MSGLAKNFTILNKPASRWFRYGSEAAVDFLLIHCGMAVTFLLLWEFKLSDNWPTVFLNHTLPVSLLTVALLTWRGVYRTRARYIGLYDFLNIVAVCGASGLAFGFLEWLYPIQNTNTPFVTSILATFFMVAALSIVRIGQRKHDWLTQPRLKRRARLRRTLIVGAGDAGEMIVREIERSKYSDHLAIGFVDDDPEKGGLIIHGVPVIGRIDDIQEIVDEYQVDEILLAVPSADGNTMRRIVSVCDETGARVRTLPAVASILKGEQTLKSVLREVEIEDLLRREPAQTDIKLSASYINGESVLVTGGGGSIGSELARQIARVSPGRLVLLGKGENSIYEIEQELVQTGGIVPTCFISDVRDRQSMEHVYHRVKPRVVFHAAAHKHVPLMQANVIEAVRNNIFGTLTTAELAVRNGVRKFVYISTDKAVNPSSVMGATKRVGEMIVRALAERSETEFAIVRFGNVLGSRGSLIPILKKQIQRGGPLRLTHPDMTRYFMTIPEAVQLILQAGYMGSKGELFILDMGEPVKIVDLAKDLIRLHGLVPYDDIEILFTGVRPGEKTHEELVYEREQLTSTSHPKINMVAADGQTNYEWLMGELKTLGELCDAGDQEALRHALMELAWGKSEVPYLFAAVETQESPSAVDALES